MGSNIIVILDHPEEACQGHTQSHWGEKSGLELCYYIIWHCVKIIYIVITQSFFIVFWLQCSVSCGHGYQYREVICSNQGQLECDPDEMPHVSRPCGNDASCSVLTGKDVNGTLCNYTYSRAMPNAKSGMKNWRQEYGGHLQRGPKPIAVYEQFMNIYFQINDF